MGCCHPCLFPTPRPARQLSPRSEAQTLVGHLRSEMPVACLAGRSFSWEEPRQSDKSLGLWPWQPSCFFFAFGFLDWRDLSFYPVGGLHWWFEGSGWFPICRPQEPEGQIPKLPIGEHLTIRMCCHKNRTSEWPRQGKMRAFCRPSCCHPSFLQFP